MTRVLVVEDDPAIAEVLRLLLVRGGYQVAIAGSGPAGWQALVLQRPDALLLDLSLPGLGGVELLRRLRSAGEGIPVLAVTADSSSRTLVQVLEQGADDYIVKPFRGPELVARLRATLRRAAPTAGVEPEPSAVLSVWPLQLERAGHRVTVFGRPLELSPVEFRLLQVFLARPAQIVPHADITREVWGPDAHLDRSILRVNVYRLRRKLDSISSDWGQIRSVPSLGWGLFAGGEAAAESDREAEASLVSPREADESNEG